MVMATAETRDLSIQNTYVAEKPQREWATIFYRGTPEVRQYGTFPTTDPKHPPVTVVSTWAFLAAAGAEVIFGSTLNISGVHKLGGVTMMVPFEAGNMHLTTFNAQQPPQKTALDVRREWMQQMGLSEDEIAEYCDESKYPASLQDELADLAAAGRIAAREQR